MTTVIRSAKLTIWVAALLALMATAYANEGEIDCHSAPGNPYYSDVDNRAMCWVREKQRSHDRLAQEIAYEIQGLDTSHLDGIGMFEGTQRDFLEAAGNVLEGFRMRRYEFDGPSTRETRKVVLDRKAAALRVVLSTYEEFTESVRILRNSIQQARPAR